MAITTYSELQADVAAWLHRADMTAQIPVFIALAEGSMSADISARAMDARTTLAVTAGNAYVTLPADMLEMRRLTIQTDPVRILTFSSPDQISIDFPLSLSGPPAVFTVIGSEMQIAPIPDAAYTLEITYKQRIPALSDSNPTNWLLTAFPGAYLYAALCAAQPFLVNDGRLATFKTLYQEAVNSINSIDWYSGTTMRVRAR